MSFRKQYPNRKDRRKPWRGSKAFDASCRNHGTCDYCRGSRTRFDAVAREVAREKLAEALGTSGFTDHTPLNQRVVPDSGG